MALIDHAVEQRFVRPDHRTDLLSGTDPEALLDALAAWRPERRAKWLDAEGRVRARSRASAPSGPAPGLLLEAHRQVDPVLGRIRWLWSSRPRSISTQFTSPENLLVP